MAFEPCDLKDPSTGHTVTAQSKREYNDLRFGSGYEPVTKKAAPKQEQKSENKSD